MTECPNTRLHRILGLATQSCIDYVERGITLNTLWVGIDIGKARKVVAIVWQESHEVVGEFANWPIGFENL